MATTSNLLGVPLVRFSHSMAFTGVLRKLGAPVDRYLESNKLPRLCQDPDWLIPLPSHYALLDKAARKEQSSLGWWVGESVGDLQLSTSLRKRLEAAPSLLVALQSLVRLVSSETSDIDMGIRQRKDEIVLFTRTPSMRGVPGYTVAQAYQISVFVSLVQLFLGKNWLPAEIGLECRSMPRELPGQYQACRFLPESPFGYFTVQRSRLHHSLARGPAENVANGELPGLDQLDELELMRGVLRSYLADGYVSQTFAAELLDTSVRSLTRRLSKHGVTYQKLIDNLRFEVAKEHLQNPDMRVRDVANAVGFEDQGDFARAFRRISGLAPSEFRRAVCPTH